MCDQQPSLDYKEGDVVWVKLGSVWWPAEVYDLRKLPEEVTNSFRRLPLVAVKFFDEDKFEYVKTLDRIYSYNCMKKNEFIKRGLSLHRTKKQSMEKFPTDVSTAETKTNGDPNIINNPMFEPEVKPDYSYLFHLSKSRKRSGNNEAGILACVSPGNAASTPNTSAFLSNPDGTVVHHSTPYGPLGHSNGLSQDFLVQNDRVHILIQGPSRFDPPEVERPETYWCYLCGFKTTRIGVLIFHIKSHAPGRYSILKPLTIPKRSSSKKRKAVRIAASANLGLDTSTVISECDENSPPIKKTKLDFQRKGINKHRNLLKTKEVEKNDIRGDLLAEWDDDPDVDETSTNTTLTTSIEVAGESTFKPCTSKPVCDIEQKLEKLDLAVPSTSQSCFDFPEEEEEDEILSSPTGRKIPRVIPPTNWDRQLDSGSSDKTISYSQNVSEGVRATDVVNKDASLLDLQNILESTTAPLIPKLPDLPNILKSSQWKPPDTSLVLANNSIVPVIPQQDLTSEYNEAEIDINKEYTLSEESQVQEPNSTCSYDPNVCTSTLIIENKNENVSLVRDVCGTTADSDKLKNRNSDSNIPNEISTGEESIERREFSIEEADAQITFKTDEYIKERSILVSDDCIDQPLELSSKSMHEDKPEFPKEDINDQLCVSPTHTTHGLSDTSATRSDDFEKNNDCNKCENQHIVEEKDHNVPSKSPPIVLVEEKETIEGQDVPKDKTHLKDLNNSFVLAKEAALVSYSTVHDTHDVINSVQAVLLDQDSTNDCHSGNTSSLVETISDSDVIHNELKAHAEANTTLQEVDVLTSAHKADEGFHKIIHESNVKVLNDANEDDKQFGKGNSVLDSDIIDGLNINEGISASEKNKIDSNTIELGDRLINTLDNITSEDDALSTKNDQMQETLSAATIKFSMIHYVNKEFVALLDTDSSINAEKSETTEYKTIMKTPSIPEGEVIASPIQKVRNKEESTVMPEDCVVPTISENTSIDFCNQETGSSLVETPSILEKSVTNFNIVSKGDKSFNITLASSNILDHTESSDNKEIDAMNIPIEHEACVDGFSIPRESSTFLMKTVDDNLENNVEKCSVLGKCIDENVSAQSSNHQFLMGDRDLLNRGVQIIHQTSPDHQEGLALVTEPFQCSLEQIDDVMISIKDKPLSTMEEDLLASIEEKSFYNQTEVIKSTDVFEEKTIQIENTQLQNTSKMGNSLPVSLPLLSLSVTDNTSNCLKEGTLLHKQVETSSDITENEVPIQLDQMTIFPTDISIKPSMFDSHPIPMRQDSREIIDEMKPINPKKRFVRTFEQRLYEQSRLSDTQVESNSSDTMQALNKYENNTEQTTCESDKSKLDYRKPKSLRNIILERQKESEAEDSKYNQTNKFDLDLSELPKKILDSPLNEEPDDSNSSLTFDKSNLHCFIESKQTEQTETALNLVMQSGEDTLSRDDKEFQNHEYKLPCSNKDIFDSSRMLETKVVDVEIDGVADTQQGSAALCESTTEDELNSSIEEYVQSCINLSSSEKSSSEEPEDLSALSTLAAVSELTTTFHERSTEPSLNFCDIFKHTESSAYDRQTEPSSFQDMHKLAEPPTHFYDGHSSRHTKSSAIFQDTNKKYSEPCKVLFDHHNNTENQNPTFLTEDVLADGQIEIASIPLPPSKPVSLRNFSIDVSDVKDSSHSDISKRRRNRSGKEHDLIERSLGRVFADELNTESDSSNSTHPDIDDTPHMVAVSNLSPKKLLLTNETPEYSSSSKLLEILTDSKPKHDVITESTDDIDDTLCKKQKFEVSLIPPSEIIEPVLPADNSSQSKLAVVEKPQRVSSKFDPKHTKSVIKSVSEVPATTNSTKAYAPANIASAATITQNKPLENSARDVSVPNTSLNCVDFESMGAIDAFIIRKPESKPDNMGTLEKKSCSNRSKPENKSYIQEKFENKSGCSKGKPENKSDTDKSDCKSSLMPSTSTMNKSVNQTTLVFPTRGKAHILQQTIIKPDSLMTTTSKDKIYVDKNKMCEIDSIPIVIGDNQELLIPENTESMSVIPDVPTSDVLQSVGTSNVTSIVHNKLTKPFMPTTNKSTTLLKTYSPKTSKNTRSLFPTRPAKILSNIIRRPGDSEKFMIVSSPNMPSSINAVKKPVLLKRSTLPAVSATASYTRLSSVESSGQKNKIMVITNQQGQPTRVLLSPEEQQKYFSAGSKIVKNTFPGNILQKTKSAIIKTPMRHVISSKPRSKHSLVITTKGHIVSPTSSLLHKSQTTISAPKMELVAPTLRPSSKSLNLSCVNITSAGEIISPLKPPTTAHTQIKGFERRIPVSFKINRNPQLDSVASTSRTIVMKTAQGRVVKKIPGAEDSVSEQQVQEQVNAIKASSSFAATRAQQELAMKSKLSQKKTYIKNISPGAKPLSVNTGPTKLQRTDQKSSALSPTVSKKMDAVSATPTLAKPPQLEMVIKQATRKFEAPKTPKKHVLCDGEGRQSIVTEGELIVLEHQETQTANGQVPYALFVVEEDGVKFIKSLPLDQSLNITDCLGGMVLEVDHAADITVTTENNVHLPNAPHLNTTDLGQQNVGSVRIITGTESQGFEMMTDEFSTQNFVEYLPEANQSVNNILTSADGTVYVQTVDQNIQISTDGSNQLFLPILSSNRGQQSRNSSFSGHLPKSKDILAAALANTEVFQQDTPTPSLHNRLPPLSPSPMFQNNKANVMEPTSSLRSPIMTALEFTGTNTKKISDETDILITEAPKNVNLPITITNPNIAQTISHQQLLAATSLDLPLTISDPGGVALNSVQMNSPSFVYALSLDEQDQQKPFSGPISMPLLNDDMQTEQTETVREHSCSSTKKSQFGSEFVPSFMLEVDNTNKDTIPITPLDKSPSLPPSELFEYSSMLSDDYRAADQELAPMLRSDIIEAAPEENSSPRTQLANSLVTEENSSEIPVQPPIITDLSTSYASSLYASTSLLDTSLYSYDRPTDYSKRSSDSDNGSDTKRSKFD